MIRVNAMLRDAQPVIDPERFVPHRVHPWIRINKPPHKLACALIFENMARDIETIVRTHGIVGRFKIHTKDDIEVQN